MKRFVKEYGNHVKEIAPEKSEHIDRIIRFCERGMLTEGEVMSELVEIAKLWNEWKRQTETA